MNGQSRPVLVVEDESAQRLMYQRALTQMGYTPRCVPTLGDAQEVLRASPFGVALLDLNLSGQSGLELFEYIRDHHPEISVVIATGYGTFEIAKRAIRLDVVDILSKPIALDELGAAVGRAWERYVRVLTPVANLAPPPKQAGGEGDGGPGLNLEDMEHRLIMEALEQAGDNRKAAAKLLGISERKLYYRLSQYEIR